MREQRMGTDETDDFFTFCRSLIHIIHPLIDTVDAVAAHSAVDQALGRPVIRVILNPQDNVILNVGELITHRAICLAD
jgi:hypothetical protein